MEIDERFIFSGHAIGASAHFHKLDDLENLDHAIPTLGSSVLAPVGGFSHHVVANFCYVVNEPRRRTLLAAQHAETRARGRERHDQWETEVEAKVRGVSVLEKFHVDFVHLEQKATRAKGAPISLIRTNVAKVEGLHLGNVIATVEFDREPFESCCTRQELMDFLGSRDQAWHNTHGWRFKQSNGLMFGTLVKKIELSGPEDELRAITVKEHVITWTGFGKIFLGEVLMRDQDRQVTLIRLKMGSDGGGSGTIGSGQTNGTITS